LVKAARWSDLLSQVVQGGHIGKGRAGDRTAVEERRPDRRYVLLVSLLKVRRCATRAPTFDAAPVRARTDAAFRVVPQ
jgi:hypothetical protein